jgi:DNA-binding transcriptional regulator GbsR (MarR family)
MARVAADELSARKQQIVNNLYDVADAFGVTRTVGAIAVREVLRIEFQRKELPDDEQRTRQTDH